MDEIPYINGQLYSWTQIRVAIAGILLTGIRAVDYDDDGGMEGVEGGGRYDVGFGEGKIKCTASITLLMDEIIALQNASPTGRIQDLGMFDVTVCYMHPVTSKIVTDVITDCHFVKNGRKWKTGDTFGEVELPLLTPKINWGKTV